MRKMTYGYRKQRKRLGEHTNVYLYEEQSEDHHCGLDLMMKQPMLDLRLEGLAPRVDMSNGRFNRSSI